VAVYSGMGERVAEFAAKYIVQTKGRWAGEPLALERWQRSFLDELFLVDEDGNRIYREALLGVPARTASRRSRR
jgi:phage terminase large subunit-like protein